MTRIVVSHVDWNRSHLILSGATGERWPEQVTRKFQPEFDFSVAATTNLGRMRNPAKSSNGAHRQRGRSKMIILRALDDVTTETDHAAVTFSSGNVLKACPVGAQVIACSMELVSDLNKRREQEGLSKVAQQMERCFKEHLLEC